MRTCIIGVLLGLMLGGICAGCGGIAAYQGGEALIRQGLDSARDEHFDAIRLLSTAYLAAYGDTYSEHPDALAKLCGQIDSEVGGVSLSNADNETVYYDTLASRLTGAHDAGITSVQSRRDGAPIAQLASRFNLSGMTLELVGEYSLDGAYAARDGMLRTYMSLSCAGALACALIGGIVGGLTARRIGRLTAALQIVAGGKYVNKLPVPDPDAALRPYEQARLIEAYNAMVVSVGRTMARLETAAQKREEFVASFAHELKTPLTSIIGYADLMRAHSLDPEHEFIAASYIYSEGRRLEALSLKLMELFVTGSKSVQLKLVNTQRFGEELARISGTQLEHFDMTLKYGFDDALVRLEPGLFTSLITNLVDNARKASEPGSVIELHGRLNGDAYEFSVSDHGRGMKPEELGRITEAFYMVDKSRARAQHGAGLGLALAQSIAQAHGTTLEFASVPIQADDSRAGGAHSAPASETVAEHGTIASIALPIVRASTRRRRGGKVGERKEEA